MSEPQYAESAAATATEEPRKVRQSMCTCASGCDSNPMCDPGVFPPCHCWCHEETSR